MGRYDKFDAHMTLSDLSSHDILDTRQLQDVIDDIESIDEEERDDDQKATLKALEELSDDIGEWLHGNTLIRESYFQEYAEQTADDIGAIDRNATWPCNCIDWERAAAELQQDYSSCEIDGTTFYYRDC